jgi:uncharacterized protein YbaA (DUF1428 family)
MAELGASVWLEHGALDYREWVADDVPYGELTSFPRAVLLEPDEVVIFAWIVYPSREARDAINARVFADPRMDMADEAMPFYGKRMIYGGFKAFVGGDRPA